MEIGGGARRGRGRVLEGSWIKESIINSSARGGCCEGDKPGPSPSSSPYPVPTVPPAPLLPFPPSPRADPFLPPALAGTAGAKGGEGYGERRGRVQCGNEAQAQRSPSTNRPRYLPTLCRSHSLIITTCTKVGTAIQLHRRQKRQRLTNHAFPLSTIVQIIIAIRIS
jgi:hypothetical protein